MSPTRILIWLLTLTFACGGVVVVERSDEPTDSADDGGDRARTPGAEDGATPIGEENWTPNDAPFCVDDCGAWISGCSGDQICVEPNATCPGIGAEHVQDLVACVCAGCAERCGGSCVMFDAANPACLECQQTMVRQTCSYEYYACLGP